MRARRARLVGTVGLLAAALSGACGGGQTQGEAFDPRWVNDGGAGIAAFQEKFAATPIPVGASVAVGVARREGGARGDGARTLVGVPLDGGEAWTYTHPLDARPAIAGGVVVGLGRGELFALDARTGKLLWTRNAGGKLRGAGDDGKTTVVSLVSTTGQRSVVLAISREGEVVRQIEDDTAIGVPAVVGRYAFLPWQGQYVTVFDLQTGGEVARALLRTKVSHAFLSGGAVFFGGAAATRLDGAIGLGAAGRASTARLPERALPGNPDWMTDGTQVIAVGATALDKARLYARPRAAGPAGIESGRFAATYYRIAVGFDAGSAAVAWAHAGEADFLGGAAYVGGFALCDARGEVTMLEARRGAVAGRASLGRPVDACVVQADGLTAAALARAAGARGAEGPGAAGRPGAAEASAAGRSGAGEASAAGRPGAAEGGAAGRSGASEASAAGRSAGGESLVEQLERVVMLPQPELASMQRLLLGELAALPDERATRALIGLLSGERTPPLLEGAAREALAARRHGAGPMLAALEARYDFLAGALRPPPVGPLADALAAMGERRAAPLLARHLNDPETSADDVRRAAAALARLAGAEELPALRTFFALYRGVTGDEAIAEAVASVGQALVRLGDAGPVQRALGDAFTSDAVRARLAALAAGTAGGGSAGGTVGAGENAGGKAGAGSGER